VQFAELCALVEASNIAENSGLQVLQFREVSVHHILPGGQV
jgi:hypothetical protein